MVQGLRGRRNRFVCLVVQVVQASQRQLSPSHSCRRRVQVGASRRLRAQLGRHAVWGRDMEWQYELLLMAINCYHFLLMAINGY